MVELIEDEVLHPGEDAVHAGRLQDLLQARGIGEYDHGLLLTEALDVRRNLRAADEEHHRKIGELARHGADLRHQFA